MRWARLSVWLVALALWTSLPQGKAPANTPVWIEPGLQETINADGQGKYLIYFAETPDLTPAYSMGWEERGQFVMEQLMGAALRSQAGAIALLQSRGARYKSYWIANVVAVDSSDAAVFNELAVLPGVRALTARRDLILYEPEKVAGERAAPIPLAVEPNIAHVGAPTAWGMGYTGTGITVANVDTGVRYTHEALRDHYRGWLGGTSYDHNYNWWDPYGDHPASPADDNGHGSHTMGTMVGDDPSHTNQIGLAPGAKWIACRACSTSSCTDASLLECAQWIAAPWDLAHGAGDPAKRPHAVNNSWGDCGTAYDSWYQTVVDNWHAAGIYPVFSTGNASNCGYSSPPGCNTVGNPGRYGNVTGVGSTGTSDGLYATHSNWGPTDNADTVNPLGYPTLKPQVLAPGTNIRSSVNTGDADYQGGWSGTSMSAPHVTALVALMWQAAPCLQGNYAQTETLIEESATAVPYASACGGEGPGNVPNFAAGWGEIDVVDAVNLAIAQCGPSGTLTGVVRDAGTTSPIAGAEVQAVGPFTRTATTDGTGTYTIPTLGVGTYTVSVSSYGYLPATVPGVPVAEGVTTTQDFNLTPAPSHTVSGIVSDATTGWPLYASLTITDYPPGTIYTDPVTGAYSVQLLEGDSYTFTASAWVPGYDSASWSITIPAGNVGHNFPLTASGATCSAPGYHWGTATTYLAESFDTATPPALPTGWSQVDVNGSTGNWATATATVHPSGQPPHSAPNLMYFNSYSATTGNDTRLYRTSGLDLSAAPDPTVSFYLYHDTGYTSNDRIQVQVSTDGGTTWQNVGTAVPRYDGTTGWAQHSVPLAGFTGPLTDVRLGLLAISAYGNDTHIDDLTVASTPCIAPLTGGLVVGNAYDANAPTPPMAGVTVSCAAGGSTLTAATPDPAVPDSFYTLFAPEGTQSFTAAKAGFLSDAKSVYVSSGGTMRQDYQLRSGRLTASPTSLAVEMLEGMSASRSFTLSNSGTLAAAFELKEIDGGNVPLGPFEVAGAVVAPADQRLPDTRTLGLAPGPTATPFAAGDVIQTWAPAGIAEPWGIAVDAWSNTVWVGSPASAWGGDLTTHEYGPTGTATGRSWPFSWAPANGPADFAWDNNSGTFWVVNVVTGADNCIYEMSPSLGYTGRRVCPAFASSERGLAYDPTTDTFFAGSWNDGILYHFTSTGTILSSVSLGLGVAGLAYNATTQHLFVMVNASPNPVYVLDAANGYALLGTFTIAGFTAYGGAGFDMDCSGHLWAVDQNANTVYEVDSGETTGMCATDVPWLSESPTSGSIALSGSQPIQVDITSVGLTTPAVYTAMLKVSNDTPNTIADIPVQLTVLRPLAAAADVSIPTGPAPLLVAFSGSATYGTAPYTYDWDFGDGTAHSNAQNPSHRYQAAGSYPVTLTVHDSGWAAHDPPLPAQTATDTHLTVVVTAGPVERVPYSVAPTKITTTTHGTNGTITWDAANCPSTNYHILYGLGSTLPSWTVSNGVCSIGVTGSYTWNSIPNPQSDSSRFLWFLVVGDDGTTREGSWGKTSAGAERGGTTASNACGCTTKVLTGTCGTSPPAPPGP